MTTTAATVVAVALTVAAGAAIASQTPMVARRQLQSAASTHVVCHMQIQTHAQMWPHLILALHARARLAMSGTATQSSVKVLGVVSMPACQTPLVHARYAV